MNDHHSPMAPKPQPSKRLAVCWALVLSSMISTPVLSAQTDISSSPITSTNAAQVKPNIMLLMDTSGSMGWGHMPDEVETQVGIGSIGYKAAQCNVLFYNSTQSYAVPKNADGTLFPTPSFSSARYDAFDTTNLTTVDLSSAFKAYDDNTLRTTGYNDTAQPAYYYTKSGGTVPITGYTSTPCTDADPYAAVVPASLSPAPPATTTTFPSSDGGTWTRTLVGAAEQQNFAIWFTYYRTRILLVKSAASLAFTPLTDSFRVGFITVKPKDNPTDAAINASKYLAIDDFTTTQRGLWFAKLFSQKPSGSSPTREGLARVGRHYAGKHDGINEGMPEDPVQFSCQQNFTIMTTDGYWNAQDESTGMGGGFIGGPVDMTGKVLVGQQDGNLNALTTNNPSPAPAADFNGTPRPIWDGEFDGTRTVTSKTVHYSYVPCGTYFNMSTTQLNTSTSQLLKTTTQSTQSTAQTLQSTLQNLQSTTQMQLSTSQSVQSTVQNLRSHDAEPAKHHAAAAKHHAGHAEHAAEPGFDVADPAEHDAKPGEHESDAHARFEESADHHHQSPEHGPDAQEHLETEQEHVAADAADVADQQEHVADHEDDVADQQEHDANRAEHGAEPEEHGTDPAKHCADPAEHVADHEDDLADARQHVADRPEHVASPDLDESGPQEHVAAALLRCQHRAVLAGAGGQLHAWRSYQLRNGDDRSHARHQLHGGGRQHGQQLDVDDLCGDVHGPDCGCVMHGGGRVSGQFLYDDDLQHRDGRPDTDSQLQPGNGKRRKRLYDDDLRHQCVRPGARFKLHRLDCEFGQQLHDDDLLEQQHRPDRGQLLAQRNRRLPGNSWTTTTCAPFTTTNVPVASCSGIGSELRQCLYHDDLHAREHEQRRGRVMHRVCGDVGEQLDDDDLHAGQHRPHGCRVMRADQRDLRQQLHRHHLLHQQHDQCRHGIVRRQLGECGEFAGRRPPAQPIRPDRRRCRRARRFRPLRATPTPQRPARRTTRATCRRELAPVRPPMRETAGRRRPAAMS